jgi:N-methylhydantoinase B
VSASETTRPTVVGGIDPITYEVLAAAFTAVVDDMGAMLEKVSFSTVTQIGKDFACVLTDSGGDVFSSGTGGLPMLLGTGAARVKAVLAHIPAAKIDDGDCFLLNDPFMGGTHGQDVAAVMPIFEGGELVAWVMSTSHWPDSGGPVPGSFNSAAVSTHAESLMITPIHLIREGEWDHEVEDMIMRNVRIPQVIRGDLRGMIEACKTGRERFLSLIGKYGRELIEAQMKAVVEQSERQFRALLAELPDGTWSFTDQIDRDPADDSDEPLTVGIDITIAGDGMVVDFSRTGPQAVGPVNSSATATRAALMASLKAVFHEVAWNQGFERVVEIVTVRGSLVDAEYPRPVSGVAASPGEKILASVHGCLMQVVPERTMACPTNLVNICIGGRDERPQHDGEEYLMYLWLAGGWGGRPGKRDAGTAVLPIGPGTNLQPVETLEKAYPVRFEAFELKPDSEGAGRHRGGFALRCPWLMTHGSATINSQGDRQRIAGWGAEGGLSPEATDLVYAPGTPEEKRIDVMSAGSVMEAGVRLEFHQSGGGGWQTPESRPPAWVLDDVRGGLVSAERAAEVYGVVVTAAADPLDIVVDEGATAARRGGASMGQAA